MGGRAGGGARGGGGAGKSSIEDRLRARYAAMSEKERYKETQYLAKEIQGWADKDRAFVQGGPHGDWQAEELHKYLSAVESKGGFSADVAKTVKKTIRWGSSGQQGTTVAKMSSSQAWVLAKAGVQHAIPTFGNTHIQHVQKMKVTSKWGGKTKTKKLVTWTEI